MSLYLYLNFIWIGSVLALSVEDISCTTFAECLDNETVSASCVGGKCECLAIMSYVLTEQIPAKEIGGINYNFTCELETPCHRYEAENGECPHHSVCSEEFKDDGECICFEDYESSNATGIIGQLGVTCERRNPCDHYSCDGIENSECVSMDAKIAKCTCEDTYFAFRLSGGVWSEDSNAVFNNSASDYFCTEKFPCVSSSCGSQQICVTGTLNGLPTANCACQEGYTDVNMDGDLVEMGTGNLNCSDIDECLNENTCDETTDCNNTDGSYNCSCTIGYLENSDNSTSAIVRCLACSGPGAVEDTGSCGCNGGAVLDPDNMSLCVCPNGFEEVNEGCTAINTASTTTTTINTSTTTTTTTTTTTITTTSTTTTTTTITTTSTTTTTITTIPISCDPSLNLIWDESYSDCRCVTGHYRSIHGRCKLAEENFLAWHKPWTSCEFGFRTREIRKAVRVTKNSSKAPWFKRSTYRWDVWEACDDSNVVCRDWYAEYDTKSGECICKPGYTESNEGCTPWVNNDGDPGLVITTEILRRLTSFEAGGELSTINALRLSAFERFFDIVTTRAIVLAQSGCSSNGRNIHGSFYDVIHNLHNSYTILAAMDDNNQSALRSLVYLYNEWQQAWLWNCRRSGYGPDPQDISDTSGSICTMTNKKQSFKCRLQFQFDMMFEKVFKGTTLDW